MKIHWSSINGIGTWKDENGKDIDTGSFLYTLYEPFKANLNGLPIYVKMVTNSAYKNETNISLEEIFPVYLNHETRQNDFPLGVHPVIEIVDSLILGYSENFKELVEKEKYLIYNEKGFEEIINNLIVDEINEIHKPTKYPCVGCYTLSDHDFFTVYTGNHVYPSDFE